MGLFSRLIFLRKKSFSSAELMVGNVELLFFLQISPAFWKSLLDLVASQHLLLSPVQPAAQRLR